jgi:hypothetical protein
MKRLLVLALLGMANNSYAQTDKNDNPVLKSVLLAEDSVKNYILVSSYYPIKGNIDSKSSSAYLSEKPTMLETENAALTQASDFFLIVKNHSILEVAMLEHTNGWKWLVINPMKGGGRSFEFKVKGDITENRAAELVRNRYDTAARIKGEVLSFNGKTMGIVSNSKIRASLLQLIDRERLAGADSSELKYRTRAELKEVVLSESMEGGELDFFTAIKGHEYDGIQIRPGLISTKLGIALYKWGEACYDLGVNTIEDAYSLYATLKGKPINEREKDYIRKGFDKEPQ